MQIHSTLLIFPFSLHDGRVLCELMNEIEEGAIPQEVSQTVQEIFFFKSSTKFT